MSLSCRHLACVRGAATLFSDIGFSLGRGEALRVQGGNGSGKTSLLRLLCGLARPDQGEVCWQGETLARCRPLFHANLLYAGHADALKPELLAWENLAYGGLPGIRHSRAQAYASLEQMGLAAEAELPVRLLSQGQRKRVALARLHLARQRPLWILDEPFSALDQRALDSVAQLLAAHLAGGGMLVYTTHQEAGPAPAQTLRLGREAAC
ncbi:cytochrome c biogenesis heme-transporting ATPase CcmA [Massilia sp. YIM B04103]|uniref:cytochrome c biogenesis heme-transporting ATPase CcmA n=1 Tax=Massilia sp. YIM B04103 TaxID=2963106 RepID=UPI00210C0746|nr:cytochrome c biogenesis heme-transporting ATPase CcmA [Massilia sp. YIM B04103]